MSYPAAMESIPRGASGGCPTTEDAPGAVPGAVTGDAPGAVPGAEPGDAPADASGDGGASVTLTDTEPLPGVGTVMFTETVPGDGGGELSCGSACNTDKLT